MDTISTETVSMDTPHSQWASRPADQRFETLQTLEESVAARRRNCYQSTVDTQQLTASPGGDTIEAGLRITGPGSALDLPSVPTNWAFGQIAARAGAPAGYLRKLPPPLAVECLNHGFRKLRDEDSAVKVMTVDNGSEETTLAAATGKDYGRIWDADVVAAVAELVNRTGNVFDNPKEWGGRKSGLYASDRDVFMFMVDGGSIVDGGSERDQLHRGFFVWNSEVGSATLGIQTFMFRAVCGNHTIWEPQDVKALRIRHTSNAPERFVNEAAPALSRYIETTTASFQSAVLKAKAYKTPADKDEAEKFLLAHGFTRPESRRALAAAEREEGAFGNLWLLTQGLTATARDMAHMDARVDLERRAGKLLDLAA